MWVLLGVMAGGLGQTVLAADAAGTRLDPQTTAQRIDWHLAAGWKAAGVEPAPLASDAEFLRRVYLDVIGRIPRVAEVRAFLEDTRPDKRRAVIEELLASPGYGRHWTHVFRDAWLPELETDPQLSLRAGTADFDAWLYRRLMDNMPYDQLVRELLTVPLTLANQDRLVRDSALMSRPSPLLFFTAKEGKPENLASATARMFLGLRLECAQCHHHPTAPWRQEQFWGYAAFFAGIQAQPMSAVLREVPDRTELVIPGSGSVVRAAFLDGRPLEHLGRDSPRQRLAEWITARDNPYFAKALVNRVWEQFFGIGLVDPVDDMEADNLPSHPELLEELAMAFAQAGFDLKFLIRAITLSQAYQRSSAGTGGDPEELRLFARMPVKGLTAQQVADSLLVALHGPAQRDPVSVPDPEQRASPDGLLETLAQFRGSLHKRHEPQLSILQALTLMNGPLIRKATSSSEGRMLTAVAEAPFLDPRQRLETLFLATLSRPPTEQELQRLLPYLESGGATGDPRKALADVFWVLLNSGEFLLNH